MGSPPGWLSANTGDRIALQPVYDAVIDRFGGLGPDVARGISLRHDWGPQYRSKHFLGSIAWLGIADDAAYIGEPETNGCAERFIRTLKEQCLWAELYDTVDDLRQAVAAWTETYNNEWLIQRHGHKTPREAFASAQGRGGSMKQTRQLSNEPSAVQVQRHPPFSRHPQPRPPAEHEEAYYPQLANTR